MIESKTGAAIDQRLLPLIEHLARVGRRASDITLEPGGLRPRHLIALKLNRWTGEGVYAQLFDRDTSPELAKAEDIICYDIDGLRESPELQTAVAFTIARAIDQQIGRHT